MSMKNLNLVAMVVLIAAVMTVAAAGAAAGRATAGAPCARPATARARHERVLHARSRLAVARGCAEGGDARPVYAAVQVYPGTQHTYWVYVPAQYDRAGPCEPDDLSGWPGVQGDGRRACARRTCSTI